MTKTDLCLFGGVALVVTAVTMPAVLSFVRRRSMIDQPNERSSHSIPTPRGGGIAVLLGFMASMVLTIYRDAPTPLIVISAVCALAVAGYIDDIRGLGAFPRLSVQIASGVLVGAMTGGVPWAAAGAIIMPAAVNMVNFMDGINALTGLQMAAWGAFTAAWGLLAGEASVAVLGAATCGTALGFLPSNAPIAKVFLGDVGSYLFGGVVGSVFILAGQAIQAEADAALVIALIVLPLLFYFVDTGFTLTRRAIARKPLLRAHREHIYQLLAAKENHLGVASAIVATAGFSALITAWTFPTGLACVALVTILYVSTPKLLASKHLGAKRVTQ